MEDKNCMMEEGLSINIVVREEKSDNGKLIIINNEELGIADFGDTLDDAILNFRKSAKLYLDAYPEKKELLKEETPLLDKQFQNPRIFL